MPFIFILLLASLPFSFEYNFTSSLGTDIPGEALMGLTTLVAFAYWLYHPASIKKQTLAHPLLLWLLVHLCWIGIAAFDSTHPLLSLKYVLAKTWYIGAFVVAPLIIFREQKWIRIAGITLATGILIAVLIILWNQPLSLAACQSRTCEGPRRW